MNLIHPIKIVTLILALAVVSACSSDDKTSTSTDAKPAQHITLSARAQDINDTNCKVCHALQGSGAPISGKPSDWQDRIGKGMDTLLVNVQDGFQAMPAMGGCFDCNEEDFRELITFMTNGAVKE